MRIPWCIPMTRERLDSAMARRGLAPSREMAQRLIMAGRVRVNSQPAAKSDLRVTDDTEIIVLAGAPEYASRGAHKLIAALDHFAVNVEGRRALDIGASTGGFTDVLLVRGAAHVIALDVGYGQIIERLRVDPRVTVLDRRNIRTVSPAELPYAPDLVTIDASFISLKLVLPAALALATPKTEVIALIKPQFEVGKGKVGKGGIVRDAGARLAAVAAIVDFARGLGLAVSPALESPTAGAKGNREYLAVMSR